MAQSLEVSYVATTDFPAYEERQLLYNLAVDLYNRPSNHEGSERLKKVPTLHCALEYGPCPRFLWVFYTILTLVPLLNVFMLLLFCVWLYCLVREYSVIMRNHRRVHDPFTLLIREPKLDALYAIEKMPEELFLQTFPGRPLWNVGEQDVTYYSPELKTAFDQIILIGFCTYLYVLAMVALVSLSVVLDVIWYIATVPSD